VSGVRSATWHGCCTISCGESWLLCGVVWCGVVWCGVVWCGVSTAAVLLLVTTLAQRVANSLITHTAAHGSMRSRTELSLPYIHTL
jgi:hypothetical protein